VVVPSLLLAPWGCSGQQPSVGSAAFPYPGVAPPASSVVPSASQASVIEEPFSLERFTPLLALPNLSKVAKAVEQEQPGAAARLLEAIMAQTPPPPAEVVRWQYLLAGLREQAGELEGAAASYELSAARAWPLKEYALVGAARVELRRGRADRALERLSGVNKSGALRAAALLLQAEAAEVESRFDLAIESYEAHLELDDPADLGLVSLRVSQALLKRYQQSVAEAAPAEAAQKSKAGAPEGVDEAPADLVRALGHARRAAAEFARDPKSRMAADATARDVLNALPASARQRLATPKAEEELYRLVGLVDARQDKLAIEIADTLLQRLSKAQRFGATGCEVQLQKAKALSVANQYGSAADSLADAIGRCQGDPDFRARLLYLGGKYSRFDGRHMQAVQRFEQLEREVPEHRLADDARLYRAQSYFKLGVEARFTELLSEMPRDYPRGDMVMDGVFDLALRRIDKGDWSGAASVLELGKELTKGHDSARGHEHSGRERYFLARAWQSLKHEAQALDEYEAIVSELPLSYYMLHAYSRLKAADSKRAQAALQTARELASSQPFSFEARPEFSTPEFVRGMELLKVGELDLARRELAQLGLWSGNANSKLIWGVALLYARAGAVKLSHNMTRGLLTDWMGRWPAGQWAQAWQIAFPRPHIKIVEREAKKNGLSPAWIYGVMREESAFDPKAVSHANAIGLMQLILPTAKLYAKPLGLPYDARSLKRPSVNIALGASALASLTQRFKENPLLALPGYNAGPGRPSRWVKERPHFDFDVWVELIPFRETRRYTKRVLASRAAYAVLYEPDFSESAMTLPIKVTN
jgi:soluble lytic murein transglycosylase